MILQCLKMTGVDILISLACRDRDTCSDRPKYSDLSRGFGVRRNSKERFEVASIDITTCGRFECLLH